MLHSHFQHLTLNDPVRIFTKLIMPRGKCNHNSEMGHLHKGDYKTCILKCPIPHVLNFRGWISLIYYKFTIICCVENVLNPTSEVQNIENGANSKCPVCKHPFCKWLFSKRGLQLPLGYVIMLFKIVEITWCSFHSSGLASEPNFILGVVRPDRQFQFQYQTENFPYFAGLGQFLFYLASLLKMC